MEIKSRKYGALFSLTALLFLNLFNANLMALGCFLILLLISITLVQRKLFATHDVRVSPGHVIGAIFLCAMMGIDFYDN